VGLILEPRDWFLLATATGEVSFREAVESCPTMCDLAAGLGCGRFCWIASLSKETFLPTRDSNPVRPSRSIAKAD
jgi:hypothetical protein